MSRHRILLLSCDSIPPAPTGSGNQAIRWGLIAGLRKAGAEVAFFASGVAAKRLGAFAQAAHDLALGTDRFVYDVDTAAFAANIAKLVDAFRPTMILCYGPDPLDAISRLALAVPIGVMSVDLEHLPILHRHAYNLRFENPKQKIKSTLQTPQVLFKSLAIYRQIRSSYPKADFVVNHAHHHAAWHRLHHGRPVLYTPNPLAALPQPPHRACAHPPRFALVGGIGGIATLSGLGWFAERVYPLIEPALVRGEFEVHLVGKGQLDSSVDRKLRHVVRRGYVDDLTEEFTRTAAVLVPTPIRLGFRTRIVDAFRHRVTVIVHAANVAGMPELSDGVNALVADDGPAFARAILLLARSPDIVETLGRRAYEDFSTTLCAQRVAVEVLRFVEKSLAIGSENEEIS